MWFSKSNFPIDGKLAIVIGASQGVGADLAAKLYSQNCSVILVARTESKLQQQVTRIKQAHPKSTAKASYAVADVSKYDECVNLWESIHPEDPDIIFCCAGSSIPKLFQDLTERDINLGLDINYKTAINVVHTGFKHVLAKHTRKDGEFKKRHVILFSSVVSFFPFIGYAQYAPMKAALQSLSIVLRQELAPYNYRVSCVFPGNFQSEGFEEEQKTKPEITKKIEGPSNPIPGDECAEMIIDQLRKGYDTITTDTVGWILGTSSLGVFLPRQWGFFQVIIGFVILIIGPIVRWVINRDIRNSITKKKQE
ncbi:3-ketodihydrosphingosine reductase TSC10 [Candida viswanathii]|uniref:3-ketodihydrosphingosine reductase TSC10 n=1 Tax=Candida viswanathii TaxID=5486 RepID=A0A367YKG1_9ASCO|nr:3-ketodihydrosphingosine reductase TSC10 [Candida viswanathii]